MVNSKIQAAEENLIHVYNRFPIALDHLQQDLQCQVSDMTIKN